MYFWNYAGLAHALKSGEVTDKQFNIYRVIFIIIMAFWALTVLDNLFQFSLFGLVINALMLGGWYVLTNTINTKGDGQDYWRRLICLTTPISVQLFVLGMTIVLAVTLVFGGAGLVSAFGGQAVDADGGLLGLGMAAIGVMLLANLALLVYFYVAFAKAFKIVSRP